MRLVIRMYNVSMPDTQLSNLKIGKIDLNVADIALLKKFYTQKLGLQILHSTDDVVTLGKGTIPLLTLHHKKELSRAHPAHAGLYHFAIVYSSRNELSRTVHTILKNAPHSFVGSADHLVSEAFYFTDPEGNGIELYYDRDRTEWQWEDGAIKMASLYIDPVEYVRAHIVVEDTQTEISMGHIHLKVGDIKKAKEFYVDVLGFTVTAELPGALFISVDGYHHHIGMNTWESAGALRRHESIGLKTFELMISEKKDFELLKQRIHDNKINYQQEKNTLTFNDPWNNQLSVTFKPS